MYYYVLMVEFLLFAVNPCFIKGLAALYAGGAFTAMVRSAFIAGIGVRVVNSETFAAFGYLGFSDTGVWRNQGNVSVGACLNRAVHSLYKFRAAVGINRVITTVVCHHHFLEPAAFSESHRNR